MELMEDIEPEKARAMVDPALKLKPAWQASRQRAGWRASRDS
jgi:hypothetical protein